MIFGLGPAGTGKTYLAVAMAVSALMAKEAGEAAVILVRGRRWRRASGWGFLPGSLREKVDPYSAAAV